MIQDSPWRRVLISLRSLTKNTCGYPLLHNYNIQSRYIKGWYDFFLVSQHVRQGTVAPTHYNVVADKHWIQTRSYAKTCLQQANSFESQLTWNGSCSSPCWYAHKLAFLVGQSLHREPSLDICDRLFFLEIDLVFHFSPHRVVSVYTYTVHIYIYILYIKSSKWFRV